MKTPLDPSLAALLPEEPAAPEPTIRLDLTCADVDLVLGALGLVAYNVVAVLIEKIRAQGLPQAEALGVLNWLDAAPVDGLTPN